MKKQKSSPRIVNHPLLAQHITKLRSKETQSRDFRWHLKEAARILLMDAMGLLTKCYQVSDAAIVAGSFGSLVGGHNIFEPAALGVPVLFGPHMESQSDLVELIVAAGAGKQVDLSNVAEIAYEILRSPSVEMKEAGLRLAKDVFGSTMRTWEKVKPVIQGLEKRP